MSSQNPRTSRIKPAVQPWQSDESEPEAGPSRVRVDDEEDATMDDGNTKTEGSVNTTPSSPPPTSAPWTPAEDRQLVTLVMAELHVDWLALQRAIFPQCSAMDCLARWRGVIVPRIWKGDKGAVKGEGVK